MRDKKQYDWYDIIETGRQRLLKQPAQIEVEDFGAGSAVIKTKMRIVADIATSSLKPKKYAQLLSRIVNHYKPVNIVELGTSFGITTSYLAAGNAGGKVYTVEGTAAIAEIAQKTFERAGFKNIELLAGNFNKVLPDLLTRLQSVDLAFVDGNHRKEPTLNYFKQLLAHSNHSAILIFDDIHWSADMEAAWAEIKQHPSVTLTVDLFFIGLVFVNSDFKIPQHFSIRF